MKLETCVFLVGVIAVPFALLGRIVWSLINYVHGLGEFVLGLDGRED